MVVQFPCLVCNRAVATNHRAVQWYSPEKITAWRGCCFPNLKIISSSIIKQSEYLDREPLSEASNKFYIPDEFNNALINLNMASQFFP